MGGSILLLNQVFVVIANYFHGIVKLFYLDIFFTHFLYFSIRVCQKLMFYFL